MKGWHLCLGRSTYSSKIPQEKHKNKKQCMRSDNKLFCRRSLTKYMYMLQLLDHRENGIWNIKICCSNHLRIAQENQCDSAYAMRLLRTVIMSEMRQECEDWTNRNVWRARFSCASIIAYVSLCWWKFVVRGMLTVCSAPRKATSPLRTSAILDFTLRSRNLHWS